jgi:glycosyltransferase involved in cell wall biosynthesis
MFPEELTERLDGELELADRVMALSPAHAQGLLRAGVPEERLIIAMLGVDSHLFSPQGNVREPGDPFRVAFVGQITQRKGLSYVLRAFQAAFGGSRDAELLLVGPIVGSSRPWRHLPRVRHIPSVPRSKLPAVYASADVFVMPSLSEAFAQTPLEAMSCGLPVVVSDITLGGAVIEHGVNGYIVPVRDPNAIAEILVELRNNSDLRQEVGARARKRSHHFSWKRFRSQMAAEVKTLVAGSDGKALERSR